MKLCLVVVGLVVVRSTIGVPSLSSHLRPEFDVRCMKTSQGETTSSSGLALNPGGEGHNEARRAADGGNGAGGTMPSPVQRASFGGGSVPPPEPPQGATATIAKTPFFSVANAFERTDHRAMDFFL